jgi:2-oxoisovalerate dehydrogenase E2 component (dihydrolipoyl transacylase)
VPNIQQFCLPDAGEGLTEAEIVSWLVKPGDSVAVNDPIVEIETAKSLVELPCPFAGVITELLVPPGVTVDVGTPIISVDISVDTALAPAEGPVTTAGRTSVLVGYGPRTGAAVRRPRAPVVIKQSAVIKQADADADADAVAERELAPAPRPLAKPPVRRLARDLGVDLAAVSPSGPRGIVTRADVERAASPDATTPVAVPVGKAVAARETRIPIKGVRKATAAAMVASAFTAPHVTEWVQVDVSRTMKLVDRLRADRDLDGVKVSPLLLVAKALLLAVGRNPGVNATWDEAAGEIVVKHFVNLGVAAATPRGLVVPNIKDAERLSLRELADALTTLTATARQGRTAPSDQTGGTITITNVGVFGVDGGTPILNPGEAAILAVGRITQQPWVHRGKVRPRWVTTLSLGFDHRLVDGDLGSRFLADIAAVLHDPSTALLW